MATREPQYWYRWAGKRVTWTEDRRPLAGLVLDAHQVLTDKGLVIFLVVARDDGFIAYGVKADDCIPERKEETAS